MILPDTLPSASNVNGSADTLEKALSALDPTVTDIAATWKGLYSAYQAPEAETVYAALAPLNTVPADLTATLGKAATALRNYATTLSSLATRRVALLSERAELMTATAAADPNYSSRRMTYSTRVNSFNADASAADADCARALNALRSHTTWNIADALRVPNGTLGGATQGLGAELLNRYRGRLLVPGPAAVLPDIPRLDQIIPDEYIGGKPFSYRPNGILIPTGSVLPETPRTIATPPGWNNHVVLDDARPSLGAPPPWARWGGRTLGVAGAGLTLWGTYTDSYNDTLTRHPEWTENERQNEAIADTALVGGSTVAGGAGGAWAGAAGGAALGSLIFPGPGTLIGGIVGGIIGGVGGGMAGQKASQAVADKMRGDD